MFSINKITSNSRVCGKLEGIDGVDVEINNCVYQA